MVVFRFLKRSTSVRNPRGKFGRTWFRRYAVCTLGKLKTTFREWDFPANKLVCRNHPCETFPPLCPGVAAGLPRDVAESLFSLFLSLLFLLFYFSLAVTFLIFFIPRINENTIVSRRQVHGSKTRWLSLQETGYVQPPRCLQIRNDFGTAAV